MVVLTGGHLSAPGCTFRHSSWPHCAQPRWHGRWTGEPHLAPAPEKHSIHMSCAAPELRAGDSSARGAPRAGTARAKQPTSFQSQNVISAPAHFSFLLPEKTYLKLCWNCVCPFRVYGWKRKPLSEAPKFNDPYRKIRDRASGLCSSLDCSARLRELS